MTAAWIGLSAAYALLALLLASLWLHARLPLWVKFTAVALVTAFYFVTWRTLPGFMGWPSSEPLPARFQLLASEIQEPEPQRGFAGVIHVWVVDLAGDRPAAAPRAYRLDYDKPLHALFADAMKRIRQGVPQLGSRTDDVRVGVPLDRSRFADGRDRLQLGDLPQARLPEK
ncbi:hypothetical protein [Plasticicumulans acidivorans]|uniref:Uncharacterized protein n=1 Tax=Plasticicumulans acidivorans TaxID=886464 RepID=A0A317MW48_9GAMM|nr:hypothetical protein [Plasticicumulans acidivorans]PWV62436.1 hypothetical protein C7443_104232 [Plasticicumulans acidivorans]